jgi:hypothetical protein
MAPVYEVPSKIEAVEIKGIGSAANIYHHTGLLEGTAQNLGQASDVGMCVSSSHLKTLADRMFRFAKLLDLNCNRRIDLVCEIWSQDLGTC